MAVNTYTPLIHEVLKKVHNAKTKEKKVEILRENNSDALRIIIKGSFDPNIEWVVPEGEVPYNKNEAPEGTEHTRLFQESKKLWRFIKGADTKTPQWKKENMFVQILEGLSHGEAEVVVAAKDKKLHQVYKGLSAAVVKEAFYWNDEFYNPSK
jgi:hypothetical protein